MMPPRRSRAPQEDHVSSIDLKGIPLFANIPDEHLAQLMARFERRLLSAGETLFTEGSIGDRLTLLVSGEVEARTGDEALTIRAFAPVGELGALAGLRRQTTATALAPSEVLSIAASDLTAFFQHNGEIGFRFHDNLTRILADKLERDRGRLEQMRANLVETQKAMKRMRDALLEGADTPLHRTLFEELDAHIEHNRRGRYLLEVPRALPLRLRVDSDYPVLRISNEQIVIAIDSGASLAPGDGVAGVLSANQSQIPVSGTVDATIDGTAHITLDLLIDESAQDLERLLARLQLLDVIL